MSSSHRHDPAIARASRKYQVLGTSENVARVRMYVGDDQVDEDFPLPKIITVDQQLDEVVNARIAELVHTRIASAARQGKEAEASQ